MRNIINYNKEVTKNLLRNKVCSNCRYKESFNIDWCHIQANEPSKGTCTKWKVKIKMRK